MATKKISWEAFIQKMSTKRATPRQAAVARAPVAKLVKAWGVVSAAGKIIEVWMGEELKYPHLARLIPVLITPIPPKSRKPRRKPS